MAGLDVIYEAVSSLLKGQVDKRTMLDNLELVLLTIDEVVSLLSLFSLPYNIYYSNSSIMDKLWN